MKEYNKDVEAMSSEWKRHEELVQQFNRLPFGEKAQNIGLLHTAIGCCRSAIDYCDHIINHINQKPKDDRKRWEDQKKQAQQNKGAISQEINNLQILINNTLAFAQAISLYQESEKKANLANLQDQNCTRRLNNVEEVVFLLNGVVHLYEEALTLAQDALNLISPYSDEESKNVLRQSIEKYRVAIAKYKNEAARWPAAVEGQRTALKERLLTLQEDCRLFEEKGLKRSSYELQKQIVPVLEQLIESSSCDEFVEELQEVKNTILAFEVEAANQRLTEVVPLLSQEDFVKQEAERKKHFFTNHLLLSPDLFLQNLLQPLLQSRALPLDGFVAKKDGHFTLYADQFYRFLVQNNTPVSNLVIKIYAQGEIVGEEKIPLPQKDTLEWQKFLTKDGMIFIPETRLKIKFGLDLRLQFAYDSAHTFSVIIAQKNNFLCNYQFLLSLDEEPLYIFNLAMPPPWQLDILRKPLQANSDRPLQKTLTPHHISLNENGQQEALSEANTYPLLDQFIQELKKDPLALASYVYNEIALVDPFVHQEEGVFYPPSIHRNALRTYLEKKGSPWEQCQLLAYLLRKAGYPTFYAIGGVSLLPKAFIEKLLLVKLGKNQREALISYPWVVFFDGKEWIPLFPWMKEIQVKEGYDLYNLMPHEYASADRWILQYLKGDETILKHIAPDGDDTAGLLFVRFLEEQLRKQGLSLTDIGLHRVQLKKPFFSWNDFPRPLYSTRANFIACLEREPSLFAKVLLEFSSHENPQKKISHLLRLADIGCRHIPLQFSVQDPNSQRLHVQLGEQEETFLGLDNTDRLIDLKLTYELPLGFHLSKTEQTLSIAKGTSIALCFHFGGSTPGLTSQYHEQFSLEKSEKKRLHALLAFVGASYFDRCGQVEEMLSLLHKINGTTAMAFGLVKLSPDTSRGPFQGDEDLVLPQVDMSWFRTQSPSFSVNHNQFQALMLATQSSYEHQILREIFNDENAVSTVKLLQLAHQQHQKKGLDGEGFLTLTQTALESVETTPEAAQSLYFPQLDNLNLRRIKEEPSGQWTAISHLLGPENPLSSWSYAYMTPGLISNPSGSYQELGT
ncbi:MAG TPA: hypothetical protein PKW79_02465, partial [Rhabdochlamydiaceae bacterium]|nr:hypothetical protein [Rhabdochlamydiaceae bacterium]